MAQVNNYLKTCVAEYDTTHNIENIRTAIIGIISADPVFKTDKYQVAIDYIESKGILGLFVDLDEIKFPPINNDYNAWDKSYFAKATIYCENNFSKERVEHLKLVGKKVFSKTKVATSSCKSQGIVNEGQSKNASSRQLKKNNQMQLSPWIIVGLTALLVIVFLVARIM